jgi:hypothetical protein
MPKLLEKLKNKPTKIIEKREKKPLKLKEVSLNLWIKNKRLT